MTHGRRGGGGKSVSLYSNQLDKDALSMHPFSFSSSCSHSQGGILKGWGGGEKRQEIINSSSSWLTPLLALWVTGQERAEGEGEPAGV